MNRSYNNISQSKNIAWILPRPRKDHYKGSMPLYCEEWLMDLAKDLLGNPDPKILNLFCGMNKFGTRVDINPDVNPDYVCDAHNLSEVIKDEFDVILADPPYSNEEAKDIYGTPPLEYMKWTAECDKLLKKGGLLIIYHKYLMPNPKPGFYKVLKRVFIAGRVYHLPRVAVYFQKRIRVQGKFPV